MLQPTRPRYRCTVTDGQKRPQYCTGPTRPQCSMAGVQRHNYLSAPACPRLRGRDATHVRPTSTSPKRARLLLPSSRRPTGLQAPRSRGAAPVLPSGKIFSSGAGAGHRRTPHAPTSNDAMRGKVESVTAGAPGPRPSVVPGRPESSSQTPPLRNARPRLRPVPQAVPVAAHHRRLRA